MSKFVQKYIKNKPLLIKINHIILLFTFFCIINAKIYTTIYNAKKSTESCFTDFLTFLTLSFQFCQFCQFFQLILKRFLHILVILGLFWGYFGGFSHIFRLFSVFCQLSGIVNFLKGGFSFSALSAFGSFFS